YRRKPAGLRTNILIALGSAMFTIISIQLGHGGTPDRIAAQIVTGVGFLGGGAILRSGISVKGMTTAATIWVNAAIGMAAGAGQYSLGAMATGLTLLVLAVLPPIEAWVERHTRGMPAVAEVVLRVIAAGAVGINLEDYVPGAPALEPLPLQVGKITAVLRAAMKAGVRVVVNARTDVFLRELGAPATRLAVAIERGNAF